jgi:hypothetical protein
VCVSWVCVCPCVLFVLVYVDVHACVSCNKELKEMGTRIVDLQMLHIRLE